MLKHMSNHGLAPGLALDLATVDPDDGQRLDFDVEAKRCKAMSLLRTQKPLFIIGSPMCTRWCSWQRLDDGRRDPDVVEKEKRQAIIHLEFITQIYREQVEGGRFFLHEHPDGADSWSEGYIQDLLEIDGVNRVRGDQCQYGQGV